MRAKPTLIQNGLSILARNLSLMYLMSAHITGLHSRMNSTKISSTNYLLIEITDCFLSTEDLKMMVSHEKALHISRMNLISGNRHNLGNLKS